MNVVIFEVGNWKVQESQRLASHSVQYVNEALTLRNVGAYVNADVISLFVGSTANAAVLREFKHLGMIATRSTGYDHIDLAACQAAGIVVCNVPEYGTHAVAEHTFALLLALVRHLPLAVAQTRQRNFSLSDLRGVDLAGKVLGIVGAGHIGQHVMRIARGFDMTVIAFDAQPEMRLEATIGMQFVGLDEVLRRCDVLSIHLPGGVQTRGIIGERELALMKPSAILVNTARGDVVVASALISALRSGRLAGAALDVLGEETLLHEKAARVRSATEPSPAALAALESDAELLSMPNVIVTPHMAYDTVEAVATLQEMSLCNIEAFVAGHAQNVVPGNRAVLQSVHGRSALVVRAGMTVDAGIVPVFTAVVSPLVDEVLRQRDDFLHDPTSLCVHDFRRALRRLHACLDMFGNLFTREDRVRLLRELAALTRKLGPTRDLDVLLDRQFAKVARQSSRITSNSILEVAVRQFRSAAAAKAQRAVRSARFTLLLGSMRSGLVELASPDSGMSLSAEVVGWLIQADAKVRKSGSKLSKLSDSRKHSLRAHVKALKYNSDVFLRLFAPNSGVQYRAALNDLHDVLGAYSDDVTCVSLMRELRLPERGRKDGHRHVSKRDSTDKQLKKVWSEFGNAPRPWSLA